MKHIGTITLYNEYETRISFYRYHDKWMRRKMIKKWEAYYQDRFQKFYYHIEPDTYEEHIIKIA